MTEKRRIIVAISGASGAIYGISLLKILQKIDDVETHLIISKAAQLTIAQETSYNLKQVQELASCVYNPADIAAPISSGSFSTDGMIVAPCSVRSLAEIATGTGGTLLGRAADVTLKERRRLVLMVRETPLHAVHLRHMITVSDLGGVIAPPVPAFYNLPSNIDDLVTHNVGRVLDLFGISSPDMRRWSGMD